MDGFAGFMCKGNEFLEQKYLLKIKKRHSLLSLFLVVLASKYFHSHIARPPDPPGHRYWYR